VSGLGLVGVFSALILFYVIVVLLDRIKEKPAEEGTED
jgi:predicted PurR-regulated permease PerM